MGMTRRSLAAANTQLQAQLSGRLNQRAHVDEMRGELYALKQQVIKDKASASHAETLIETLQAENARLREALGQPATSLNELHK